MTYLLRMWHKLLSGKRARFASRMLLIGLLAAILFYHPHSPIGPDEAHGFNAPEMPGGILVVVAVLALAIVFVIRRILLR